MKTGKVILFTILGLATIGLVYVGYRLIKKALEEAADKAVEEYLKNPTEENKQKILDAGGTLPPTTVTSQTTITWAANDTFPLKKGDIATAEGSNVKRLQTALKVAIDGYFGNDTETALKASKLAKATVYNEPELKSLETGTSVASNTFINVYAAKVGIQTYKYSGGVIQQGSYLGGNTIGQYVGKIYKSSYSSSAPYVYVDLKGAGIYAYILKTDLTYYTKNDVLQSLTKLTGW